MEFRILGPLDVVENGAPLPLGPYKQRALLAVLVLHRGEVVSVDRIADALWGERAPPAAAKSVQVYVSNLRKVLGAGVLETRGPGYVLNVDPDELDVARFGRLLERGRELLAAGDARAAAQVLREGLALWRGPPLQEHAYESFAQSEIARLEELRLAAVEERIDADLALGRHAELVPELEALVHELPLRERLRGQLMLALYGSGRQADALEAYQQARQALLQELGIEPSPFLREIQGAVLRQDPKLVTSLATRARLRRRRRSGLLVALGGAAVLAGGIAASVAVIAGDDERPLIAGVQPLPTSFCSPLQYAAGSRPRLLIVSDQGLRGPDAQIGNQIARAVEYVLRENGFKAGRHAVAYQACDDSTPDVSGDPERCADNGRAYAANSSIIGIVGPTLSICAKRLLPIVNGARDGAIPMVSPSNTAVGLTREGLGAEEGEPSVYYPSGARNYVRLMPADDLDAAANAVLARRLGVRRVFVLTRAEHRPIAGAFVSAARKLRIEIAGHREWRSGEPSYEYLARSVQDSGARAVFLAGPVSTDGAELVRQLRKGVGRGVQFLVPAGLGSDVDTIGVAAEGMTVSLTGLAPGALDGEGKRFVSRLEGVLGDDAGQYAVYAAQATQLLLDAIARSDGTRASVVRELFASQVRNGILGDFDVTATGDTTANHVTIYRVVDGRLRFERVITPPVSLIVPG